MSLSSSSVDLQACAREPIHIPGAIQPHGMLLCVRVTDGVLSQVSVNSERLLGFAPADCLGKSYEAFLEPVAAKRLREAISAGEASDSLTLAVRGETYEVILHRSGEQCILEFEPISGSSSEDWNQSQNALTRIITTLQRTSDLHSLCDAAAVAVRTLTGFDRVMIYRFNAEWNGEVVAEAKSEGVHPYLGLHFPASDIPEQARRLYLKNWLRLIVDANYEPVPLIPKLNPETGHPLDLSDSVLRSVSPVHLEYLRNMGVAASMSISLIRDGKLWGLIACHHESPRHLSAARRAACQLVGQIMSAEIASKEAAGRQAARLEARAVQLRFFEYLANEENFLYALLNYAPELLAFLNAKGAAVCVSHECHLLGATPGKEHVWEIVERLRTTQSDDVFHTDALERWYPPAEGLRAVASGLLAIPLSELKNDYVLWFRPEVVSTVNWAGNPAKTAEQGSLRIHPRKSFETWKEVVTGRSLPWSEVEIAAAVELRSAIGANILKRYDRLRQLNTELEGKNLDLDSFAHIASHDLKEPLRSIRNSTTWVLEDFGEKLEPECRERLTTVAELITRLEQMLDALLHFSRVGRSHLRHQSADVDEVVQHAIEALDARIRENNVSIEVKSPLGTVRTDPKLLTEVFTNLISNAIKYNTSDPKKVEVGMQIEQHEGGSRHVYYVRDNGIGIRPQQQDEVFRIFRRLHTRDAFGGGTGAGLAIVRSIVERHGGQVWLESTPGEGSTFYFSLQA